MLPQKMPFFYSLAMHDSRPDKKQIAANLAQANKVNAAVSVPTTPPGETTTSS
jgi:hypothetical protein